MLELLLPIALIFPSARYNKLQELSLQEEMYPNPLLTSLKEYIIQKCRRTENDGDTTFRGKVQDEQSVVLLTLPFDLDDDFEKMMMQSCFKVLN